MAEDQKPILLEGSDSMDDLFANAKQDREEFTTEAWENDQEPQQEEGGANQQQEKQSKEAQEANRQAGRMVISFLDQTRAMCLSLFIQGDTKRQDQFIYYKNWDDPKHSGMNYCLDVLGKKYNFVAIQYMPEIILIGILIISTVALFKEAKSIKEELKKDKTAAHQSDTNKKFTPL